MSIEEIPDVRTLGRTAAWLAKQVELGAGEVELTLPQYRVLGLLDERSAVSSDLANLLAVRPPTVTAVVDGLVARNLVERRHADSDRRRVDHTLTPLGRRLLEEADLAVHARLQRIAQGLATPEEQSQAFTGLATWRRAFGVLAAQRAQGAQGAQGAHSIGAAQ